MDTVIVECRRYKLKFKLKESKEERRDSPGFINGNAKYGVTRKVSI